MSIFAFVLFFYPIAVFTKDICKDPPYQNCPMPFKTNFGPLLSDQAVEDICPKMLPYIDCLGKYDETCGDQVPRKVFPDEGEYDSIRAMIVDICDETTLIHAVLTESIPCLRNGLFNDDNNTCYHDKYELVQELGEKGSDDDETSYSPSEGCFLQLYGVTCYVEYVEKNCGILAKDAIIEVFDRSFILRKYCHPENAAEFAEDVGKIEKMEVSLKDIMREFAKKVLKKEDTTIPS